ncbi:hypothetical protein MKW94_004047, partial [Papaver nudicaule]|nr:hypothetical protein [Papaver nudicaule]
MDFLVVLIDRICFQGCESFGDYLDWSPRKGFSMCSHTEEGSGQTLGPIKCYSSFLCHQVSWFVGNRQY